MNQILHSFGFGVVLKGSPVKPKRTKESILGFSSGGVLLYVEYSLPKDRDAAVKEMFSSHTSVTTINIKPLRGKTVVITR